MELTSKQVAERLGVSPQRVRALVKAGRIKSRLITPRLQLIDEKELVKVRKRPPGRWPKSKMKGAK
jgi:excisionase family DNA binding protein